ncbi:MAG: hypothetical protein K6G52_08420 [Treponemataceae bacterium]|nr:hypothetical protein [Treponemataceae bacterium]
MADLSAFATRKQADEGVILPVAIDGVKLPMAIQIFGQDSDCVKEYEREKLRKLMKTTKKHGNKGFDEDELDELIDEQDEAVIVRMGKVVTYDWKKKKVVENEPVELYGKTILDDHESKEYLIKEMPALKDWVKENSDDRSNFLSAGKKN